MATLKIGRNLINGVTDVKVTDYSDKVSVVMRSTGGKGVSALYVEKDSPLVILCTGSASSVELDNCGYIEGDIGYALISNCLSCSGNVGVDANVPIQMLKEMVWEGDSAYSSDRRHIVRIEGSLCTLCVYNVTGVSVYTYVKGNIERLKVGNCAYVKGNIQKAKVGNKIRAGFNSKSFRFVSGKKMKQEGDARMASLHAGLGELMKYVGGK